MADIQSRILSEYGIDIAQEDILKIYKIGRADLSQEELEQKISDTRKRLNGSVNGANEKLADSEKTVNEKSQDQNMRKSFEIISCGRNYFSIIKIRPEEIQKMSHPPEMETRHSQRNFSS